MQLGILAHASIDWSYRLEIGSHVEGMRLNGHSLKRSGAQARCQNTHKAETHVHQRISSQRLQRRRNKQDKACLAEKQELSRSKPAHALSTRPRSVQSAHACTQAAHHAASCLVQVTCSPEQRALHDSQRGPQRARPVTCPRLTGRSLAAMRAPPSASTGFPDSPDTPKGGSMLVQRVLQRAHLRPQP